MATGTSIDRDAASGSPFRQLLDDGFGFFHMRWTIEKIVEHVTDHALLVNHVSDA